MDNTTPTGTAPLQTDGAPQGSTPSVPTENVEVLQSQLNETTEKLNQANESLLAANRKIELGEKFAKFEEFQSTVLGKLETLEKTLVDRDKEISDLKNIFGTKSAITPNVSAAPAGQEPVKVLTEEEQKTRNIFGLPPKQ